MRISRRAFMKYCAVAAGALGLTTTDLMKIEKSFAKIGGGGPYVVWLPGQACTGCTTSIANSIYYTDIASLVLQDIDLVYSETLAAAAGEKVVDSAISAIGKATVLALEGAIPSATTGGDAHFCTVWTRSSGIVAANSIVNGTTVTDGKLTRKLTTVGLINGDVIKLGSEIVAGTSLPAGTSVSSAADRAALGGTYATTGTGGSDIMNTGVWTAADITTAGTITMYGGTSSPYPSGSILAVSTLIADGTTVLDSFDRWHIEHNFTVPGNPADTVTWLINTGGGLDLDTASNAGARLTAARTLSGQVILQPTSVIAAGSYLQALTKVPNTTDQNAIDSTLAVFGYGVSDSDVLASTLNYAGSDYVLQGDVTLTTPGLTGTLGFGTTDNDKTMENEAALFATSAAAVLCIGTCSSFGGIPAAQGNLTGAAGVLYQGRTKPGNFNGALTQFAAKTINIAGCPPHPDWMVGTIAYLLATNFSLPALEAYGRPQDYYGEYQCNAGPCEWRYNQGYKATDEASYTTPKDSPKPANASIDSSKLYKYKWDNDPNGVRYVGCIGVLGCKGRKTKADCSMRRWNADAAAPTLGAGWCVSSGAGCHGCTEPAFPDKVGKFFNFA